MVVPAFADFFPGRPFSGRPLFFLDVPGLGLPPKLPELSKYSRPTDAPPGARGFSQDFQGWPLPAGLSGFP